MKMFTLTRKYRLEAPIEADNAFNAIVCDNPDLNVSSPNFGTVTRKRIDAPAERCKSACASSFE